MSQAEQLLAQLLEDREAALERMIKSKTAEDLYLDFKRSADNGAGLHLHKGDQESLRIAVSGFGNSEGGLIVWGVHCPSPRPGREDAPSEARFPLANAKRFKANLDRYCGGATVPPHGGVSNHVVSEDADGKGHVATLIPYAENGPLQTANDASFYLRAGSNFVPMPHAVTAAMFGRRPAPQLFIHCHNFILEKFPNQLALRARVDLQVVNQGLGIARDLYSTMKVVSLPTDANDHAVAHSLDSRMIVRSWTLGHSLTSEPGVSFPPGNFVEAFQLTVKVAHPIKDRLAIEVVAGCDNGPPCYLTLEQTKDKLQVALDAAIRGFMADEVIVRRVFGLAIEDQTEG